MRAFLVVAIASCCGLQGAAASLAPPGTPCPDREREFVELTLARLVRHGFIDQRNLIAYREPRRRDPLEAACMPPLSAHPPGHIASAAGGP